MKARLNLNLNKKYITLLTSLFLLLTIITVPQSPMFGKVSSENLPSQSPQRTNPPTFNNNGNIEK
jgi:hypothetical protein